MLLDTEEAWDEAREQIAQERGGRWHEGAQRAMMGMSSKEWSRYMHDVIGVPDPPEQINDEVVRRLEQLYRERLPLIPGALEAVRRIGSRWPLAIASSSNRPLIDLFLELTGTAELFRARSRQRRSSEASRLPMSTSRQRDGWASSRPSAPPSRTPRTASARRLRPG